MKDRMFTDKVFFKKLIRLTLPITLQSLMLALVGAADALMLGSFEQNAMAAVSLATQIQFVQNTALESIVAAGSVLGAQYWGKGDEKALKEIFCITLRVAFVLSFVFFVGCVFFPQTLMLLYTNDETLIGIGVRYLRIAGWSYLMTGVSIVYLTMMKVSEHAAQSAWISSAAVVLNIILNAVFIYGWFGIAPMGVQGAALATLIARTVELIWCIGISMKKDYLRPSAAGLFRYYRILSKDFAKTVLPLLGAAMFWGIGFTSYTSCIGHLGQDAAAANSVATVVRDIFCCTCAGLAVGGGIMVGNELGAGDLKTGRLYGDRLMKLAYIFGFASMGLVLLVTPALMKIVRLTDEAGRLLVQMMIIMSIYMIGRVVNQVIINGIFTAGGDTIFDMYSLAVCMWGIAVPIALLATYVFHWPAPVVFACTCLDEVGKIPWVMYHYRKFKWVKDLTRDITNE